MQSTGHSSTQARSFTSMQGSQIVYVIRFPLFYGADLGNHTTPRAGDNRPWTYEDTAGCGASANSVPRIELTGSMTGTG